MDKDISQLTATGQMEYVYILVWGCNEFSRCLYELLQGTRVRVVAFIDDEQTGFTHFCGQAVHDPQTLNSKEEWAMLPVVIAVDHFMLFKRPVLRFKSISQFKEKIQTIQKQYHPKQALLHPAALVDFLPLTFRNKVILFGLQGSGNVMFMHIFQAIYKKYFLFFFTRYKRNYFFESMCREYMHLVQQVVSDCLHGQGGYDAHAVAWKIGTSHYNCRFDDNILASLYTLSTREQFASFVAMYHQMPSQAYLNKLYAMQFNVYFVMRNPLDVILSGINKSAGINADDFSIDENQFRCIAKWVIDQLQQWQPLVATMPVLRYEHLLAQPVQTIKKIMRDLRLLPSARWAKKIWRQLGFKQLPQAFKKHFWKGGTGKWEQYFKAEHLLFLKHCGIEALLEKYHYPEVLQRFRALTATLVAPKELAMPRSGCYQDERYDTMTFLKEQNGERHCVQSGDFYVVCQDADKRQALKTAFENAYIQCVLRAGAHPDYRLV